MLVVQVIMKSSVNLSISDQNIFGNYNVKCKYKRQRKHSFCDGNSSRNVHCHPGVTTCLYIHQGAGIFSQFLIQFDDKILRDIYVHRYVCTTDNTN